MQQIRSWLSALPFSEALERRQALTLQGLILSLSGAAVLDLGSLLITPAPLQNRLLLMVVVLIFLLCMLGAFGLLRRGHLAPAAIATVATLLLAFTIAITLTGLRGSARAAARVACRCVRPVYDHHGGAGRLSRPLRHGAARRAPDHSRARTGARSPARHARGHGR